MIVLVLLVVFVFKFAWLLGGGPSLRRRWPITDVPDPVAGEWPVKGKSTEGSDDEDREQRPYRCSHSLLLSAPSSPRTHTSSTCSLPHLRHFRR
jgi:hypothetical protein